MESENKIEVYKSDYIDKLSKLCGKKDLIQFPKKYKARLVLLGSIVFSLKPRKQYSEKLINESLIEWISKMAGKSYLDYVTLRRYLIDFGLLKRDPAGRKYYVAESKINSLFEKSIREIDSFSLVKKFRVQRKTRRKK
jgi:hypothetical protein